MQTNPPKFNLAHTIADDLATREGTGQTMTTSMLEMNSYDTVCHEHLEYYALKQIVWMADRVGFLIKDVCFNSVNGGSFSVTVKKNNADEPHTSVVYDVLESEKALHLDSLSPYVDFAARTEKAKTDLIEFISKAKSDGKSVYALGASTKGNVLLQYCGLKESDVSSIGEVNPEKYGRYAPGSNIPIISEDELLKNKPEVLIVLPWHFKEFFVSSNKFEGLELVFPLPSLVSVKMERSGAAETDIGISDFVA